MIYTLIVNRKSYDLPARTLAIAERLESIAAIDSDPTLTTRQKYAAIWDCIKDLLGEKNAEQIIGAAELDEMDLSDLLLTFRKIVDAYNRPVREYEREQNAALINQLPLDKIGKMEKLADLIKSAEKDD